MKKRQSNQEEKKNDYILFAFLATFLSIIGFVIALAVKRDDKYVMFYAKQSLVVFVSAVVLGIAGMLFYWLPGVGGIIRFAVNAVIILLWALSWIYALSGKMKEVPVVGHFGKSINL